MISGIHRGINETLTLLGCYAASVCSYQYFGRTCRSHLQWSSRHAWPCLVE